MDENVVPLYLTPEDIARYQAKIKQIDLNLEEELFEKVPDKLDRLLKSPNVTRLQLQLVRDVSKLLLLMQEVPQLDPRLKRKILFALQYFYDPYDDIPDSVANLGFLDDAVVVRWVIDQIISEYPEYFKA